MKRDDEQQRPITTEQEEALKVYIDALLLEPAVEEAPPEPAPAVVEPAETEPETVTGVAQAEVAATETQPAPPPVRQEAAAAPEEPFDCLLFKVAGGLPLAVPLAHLTGIMKWEGEITPIPGHAEWFLGLVPNRGRQVKVIDIAKFVIPENHQSRQALAGERHFKHLLLIDDGRLGLACDELGKVVKLNADQVRWRQDSSRRPWLAGTLIEQMSALLHVDKLSAVLKEGTPLDEIS